MVCIITTLTTYDDVHRDDDNVDNDDDDDDDDDDEDNEDIKIVITIMMILCMMQACSKMVTMVMRLDEMEVSYKTKYYQ
jgi:hypothetical protein